MDTIKLSLEDAFSIDHRTLSLFRVMLGLILVADQLMRFPYIVEMLTNNGLFPIDLVKSFFTYQKFSLLFLNGSAWFAYLFSAVLFASALGVLFGYKTRASLFICWVLLLSLHFRAPLVLSLADVLLRILMFWALFLPIDRFFSIDAALSRAKESTVAESKQSHFSIASIAMLFQVSYVYWAGALLKTSDAWRVDHTAVWLALKIEHYSNQLGVWVADNLESILPTVNQFVFLIELFGPLLLVFPIVHRFTRLPVLALLIIMHLGFLILLNVGIFPYVSIASLILFLPASFWDWLAKKTGRRSGEGIHIYYDKGCNFCLKTVLILKQFLLLPNATVSPVQDNDEANKLFIQYDTWVVKTPAGELKKEWEALYWLFEQSRILAFLSYPMKWIGKLNIGDKIYHFIGNNRATGSQLTRRFLPWNDRTTFNNGPVVELVVGILFAVIMATNLLSLLPTERTAFISVMRSVTDELGMTQKWRMFAPIPVQETHWPIFEGETQSGQKIDLFRTILGPVPLSKPAHILSEYDYYRYRKYHENLFNPAHQKFLVPFAKTLCQRYAKQNQPLSKLSLSQGKRGNNPKYSNFNQDEVTHLLDYSCKTNEVLLTRLPG